MNKKFISAVMSAVIAISLLAPMSVSADEWVKTDSGYKYQLDDGSYAETGWLTIDGVKYYITKDGVRKTGWLKTKTAQYYFDKNGKMVTGKAKIDGKTYTFGDKGILVTDTTASTDTYGVIANKSTLSVSAGDTATLCFKGKANTEYTISVYYGSGASKADGLKKKVSDKNGNVSWEWKVGTKTNAGDYKIKISDGTNTYSATLTVK